MWNENSNNKKFPQTCTLTDEYYIIQVIIQDDPKNTIRKINTWIHTSKGKDSEKTKN